MKGGRGYNDCGQKCTKVDMYDPSRDHCFKDKDNDGKYCWYGPNYIPVPVNQWERRPGAREYDNCDAECTEVTWDGGSGY